MSRGVSRHQKGQMSIMGMTLIQQQSSGKGQKSLFDISCLYIH